MSAFTPLHLLCICVCVSYFFKYLISLKLEAPYSFYFFHPTQDFEPLFAYHLLNNIELCVNRSVLSALQRLKALKPSPELA